jgi:hypothetical protein
MCPSPCPSYTSDDELPDSGVQCSSDKSIRSLRLMWLSHNSTMVVTPRNHTGSILVHMSGERGRAAATNQFKHGDYYCGLDKGVIPSHT